MSKGINRIIISDEHISNGQIIKFPQLLNGCEVYGLIANGNWVTLSVEMDEKVFLDVEDKVKNKQIHSGIKWVYGKVYNFQKGGISWHGWYTDTNRNNKKDENEEWVNNKPVEQISKIDLHNVQGNYTIQKTIQIKFDNKPYDTPALSWVEPFLIHPELHFSKKPKGIFIVPIAEPKIYRTDLLINNSPFDRKLQIPLPKTEKESQENENVVYYGENLIFSAHVCTLLIPESAEFTVKIDQKVQHGSNSGFLGVKIDSYQTIYEKKVNGLKPENDNFWSEDLDYELVSYLSQYFKRAELLIPLAIDKKPEDQKEKTKRTFFVTLKHIYQAYSATNTDFKKLYPIQQGYLTIGYTDMENLLEIQNKEVDEYVEKAGDVLLQPNGEPCHYTWIKAHKEDEEITLFEEKKEGIKFDPIEIDLITGDENPYLLTLSTNLKTEECKTQQHTKGGDSVFYFPTKLSSEKQGIKIQKIDYSSVDLLIPYKYIRDHSTLVFITDFPFNYFWLAKKNVQKHVVMVDTCRYNIPVKINVYPDVNWEIKFEVGSVLPETYSHTNFPTANGSFEQHQQDAIKAGQNRRCINGEVYFELSLQAEINNIKRQYSFHYEQKIKSILKSLVSIKEGLDKLCGLDKIKPKARTITSKVPGMKKLPFTLQIDYPVISILGNWNYGNNSSNKKVVRQGQISLGFTPLIKATGKIDLIACAEYYPPARRFIQAARWAAEKLNGDIWFNLYATGEIDLQGNLYFNQEKNVEPLSSKTTVTLGVELGAKIASDIEEVSFRAETVNKIQINGELSAKGETSLSLNAKAGFDDKGIYIEFSLDFGGVVAYLTAKAKIWDVNVGIENKAFTIVDEKPDLFKQTLYF